MEVTSNAAICQAQSRILFKIVLNEDAIVFPHIVFLFCLCDILMFIIHILIKFSLAQIKSLWIIHTNTEIGGVRLDLHE